MRIFGSDRIKGWMQTLGMEDGVPIEHSWVTKSIARAQKQVEAQNFSVRKHLLEYDDVMNKQRENVYGLRRQLLEGQIVFEDDPEPVDIRAYLMTIAENILDGIIDQLLPPATSIRTTGTCAALKDAAAQTFNLDATELEAIDEPNQSQVEIRDDALGADSAEVHQQGSRGRPRAAGYPRKRAGPDRAARSPRGRSAKRPTNSDRKWRAAPWSNRSRAASCCRSSTRSGRITSTASTT